MTRALIYIAGLALIISVSSCAHKPEFTRVIPHGIGDGPRDPHAFCREHRGGVLKIENGRAVCVSGSVLNLATGEVE